MSSSPVLALVGTAAGGVELIRTTLVQPLIDEGWTVGVTLTPAAAVWLADSGELQALEKLTGLPVRSAPRLPREPRPHPDPDCCAVVPATANTVAKLALGLADNQALTQTCEAIGFGTPVVVFPRINAAHVRQPAWKGHIEALSSVGVRLIYGDDV